MARSKGKKQIVNMIYYGRGFTHSDLYNMAVYLRNFYFQVLVSIKGKVFDRPSKRNGEIG